MSEEGTTIPNYLWQSIVVTILCCLPLGIPAIVFAAKVNGLAEAGKIDEAKAASDKAKKFCWIAFGLGLVVIILQIIVQLGAVGAVASQSGY